MFVSYKRMLTENSISVGRKGHFLVTLVVWGTLGRIRWVRPLSSGPLTEVGENRMPGA